MKKERKVVLDTETTGLNCKLGDRVIEIACVEILNNRITNNIFHSYLKTNKTIDKAAYQIHGISNKLLINKPKFKDIATELLEFLGNSELIIHNAEFDLAFINSELLTIGWKTINKAKIIDTLQLVKKMFPGRRASLEALCKRFKINLTSRSRHTALIDAKLLALVYMQIYKKEQSIFDFKNDEQVNSVYKRKHLVIDRHHPL